MYIVTIVITRLVNKSREITAHAGCFTRDSLFWTSYQTGVNSSVNAVLRVSLRKKECMTVL